MVKYSKTGEYHKLNKIVNQDFIFRFENEEAAFFAVADGVSSCANSRQGAEIACKTGAKVILDDVDYYFGLSPQKTINILVANIKNEIEKAAAQSDSPAKSFASTLCFACIEKKSGKMMTFVLGDSRIYSISGQNIDVMNPVRSYGHGITCTTMTDRCESDARLEISIPGKYSEYMLCTDGCWKNLFFTDEKNRLNMRESSTGKAAEYLKSRAIDDDCSFLLIANQTTGG